MKVILVDDEEAARSNLSALLHEIAPDIEIMAQCAHIPDAVIAVNKLRPDLVFLDIEMPEYNGFEFFDFFREIDFDVIFVTAYNQYALRAFEVSAVDYILKPIDKQLLQNALQKVKIKHSKQIQAQRLNVLKENYLTEEFQKIGLPTGDGIQFVPISEIVLFEADRAYTHVHLLNGKKLTMSKPLRTYEELLIQQKQFYRPHRSYLMNINFIEKYIKGDSIIFLKGELQVYVSRERKAEFEAILKSKNLK